MRSNEPIKIFTQDSAVVSAKQPVVALDINKTQPQATQVYYTESPYISQKLTPELAIKEIASTGRVIFPTPAMLDAMVQISANAIDEICIDSSSFIPRPNKARFFLNGVLEDIERDYQKSQEDIELARLITDIGSWVISATSVVVSIVATPAVGKLVASLGGIAISGANLIIDKIEEGIQRGSVSPDVLDKIGFIAKDEYYFDMYKEKYYGISKSETEELILKIFKTYEEVMLIPNLTYERMIEIAPSLAEQMTREDFIEGFKDAQMSFDYWAERSKLEIILSVLCNILESFAPPPQTIPTKAPFTPTKAPPKATTLPTATTVFDDEKEQEQEQSKISPLMLAIGAGIVSLFF